VALLTRQQAQSMAQAYGASMGTIRLDPNRFKAGLGVFIEQLQKDYPDIPAKTMKLVSLHYYRITSRDH